MNNILIYKDDKDALIKEADVTLNHLYENGLYEESISFMIELVNATFRNDYFKFKTLFYPQLDNYILKLSDKFVSNKIKEHNGCRLHVIIGTEFDVVGGHSRIAKQFNALTDSNLIVLTDIFNHLNEHEEWRLKITEMFYPVPVIFIPSGTYTQKTKFLINLLDNLNPLIVSCFNHHQDPIPLIATSRVQYKFKFYYHHCDHEPSLGASITEYIHIDTNEYTHEICKNLSNFQKIFHLPLCFENKSTKNLHFETSEKLNTFSVGKSSRYFIGRKKESKSYPWFLVYLFKNGTDKHFHVGELTNEELVIMGEVFIENDIDANRFVYLGTRTSVIDSIKDIKNIVFLPSFPIGGGLTLIECISLGIPIIFNCMYEIDPLNISENAFISLLPDSTVKISNYLNIQEAFENLKKNYLYLSERTFLHYKLNHSLNVKLYMLQKIFKDDEFK